MVFFGLVWNLFSMSNFKSIEIKISSDLTFFDAWQLFMQERSISLSPTSIVSDYNQTTKWIKRCPIQNLTQGRQILLWVLSQEPVQSARRVSMFIRSMYKWASSDDVGILNRNPVANFKMPKAPQKNNEVRIILREEIPIILNELKIKQHHKNVKWDLFAEFMLQTGMRTGEVRALTWKDIEETKIKVHKNYTLTHGLKNSTKTNKQRWVPINNKTKEILNKLETKEEYLFPWKRYTFQSFFREKVDKLYNQQLVKDRYRPYDLRHVAISRWLEAGIPVAQAAFWAGNTSEVIWKHYAGATQDYEMPVI